MSIRYMKNFGEIFKFCSILGKIMPKLTKENRNNPVKFHPVYLKREEEEGEYTVSAL